MQRSSGNKLTKPNSKKMNIDVKIVSKDEFPERILTYIQKLLGVGADWAEVVYKAKLIWHIDQLKDSISVVIEFPYVDKVYRNSYYNYFSSKLGDYSRECIRLSFFNSVITDLDFQDNINRETLQENFLGFMVLRPTISNIIGRSIISPKALKQNSFIGCLAKFSTTVFSVKLDIVGFPYSSQDSESISCAETTLWSIMEYFSQKYAEYSPVLPSKIIEILKRVSTERQLPSKGLDVYQISYSLREFGFGTRLYSRDNFGDEEFRRLFACYIESGLPIIVAIDNRNHGGNTGHAIICMGHENVTKDKVDFLEESKINGTQYSEFYGKKNLKLFDNDDIDKKFVFIDDNRPVYQQMLFRNPVGGYTDPLFKNSEINHFIVPLYSKIYLEAFEAKNFCRWFLFKYLEIPDGTELYLRFFLTSSRSYKDSLKFNSSFNDEIKQLILEKPMPKFIWVGEISDKKLIRDLLANGLVLLDATEANTSFLKPLLISAYLNRLITIDSTTHLVTDKKLYLQNFSIFTNNLK
jgi:hypothetical protein